MLSAMRLGTPIILNAFFSGCESQNTHQAQGRGGDDENGTNPGLIMIHVHEVLSESNVRRRVGLPTMR